MIDSLAAVSIIVYIYLSVILYHIASQFDFSMTADSTQSTVHVEAEMSIEAKKC